MRGAPGGTWAPRLVRVAGFCQIAAGIFVREPAPTGCVAGTALLLGNGWVMTGGTAGSLTLAVGAHTAMLWVSSVSARLLRTVDDTRAVEP